MFTCVCWRLSSRQVNRQEPTHPTLSFRAGPIRMGRAKNLPVGGNGARVRRLCLLVCAPAGGDPSACGRQDDSDRGMPVCVCWRLRLRGEILPAVGRRKRTACGRQDDTRKAGRIALKDLNQARQHGPPIFRPIHSSGLKTALSASLSGAEREGPRPYPARVLRKLPSVSP